MRAPWPARLHGLPLGLVVALKLVAFVALLTGAWFLSWIVSDARVKAGEPFDLQRASTIAVVVGAWLVTFEYLVWIGARVCRFANLPARETPAAAAESA